MSNEYVPKAMGSEVEYGLRVQKSQGERGADATFPDIVPSNIAGNLELAHLGQFLQNGGRIYKDVGDHPEYATPECTTLEELVIHELAGEVLICQSCWNNENIRSIHKRSITPSIQNKKQPIPITHGAHENYETNLQLTRPELYTLATHFATRTTFTGAGWYENGELRIGQKVHALEHTTGAGNTSDKALVNTRHEPHVDQGLQETINRLHVTSGDANISPWTIRTKFGTTALLIRMLEAGYDFEDLHLNKPVEAARFIGGYPQNMNKPLELVNGKKMSALDIQEALAERACNFTEISRLPRDLQEIGNTWIEFPQALRHYQRTGDVSSVMENFDWFNKQKIVERAREKKPSLNNNQVSQLDLSYDKIPDGFGDRLRKKHKFAYNPTEIEKERACKLPPESRAQLRGAFILNLYNQQEMNSEGWSVNWKAAHSKDQEVSFGRVETRHTDKKIAEWIASLNLGEMLEQAS